MNDSLTSPKSAAQTEMKSLYSTVNKVAPDSMNEDLDDQKHDADQTSTFDITMQTNTSEIIFDPEPTRIVVHGFAGDMTTYTIDKLSDALKQQTNLEDKEYKEYLKREVKEIEQDKNGRDPVNPMIRKEEIFESDHNYDDFLKEMFKKVGIRNVFGKSKNEFSLKN